MAVLVCSPDRGSAEHCSLSRRPAAALNLVKAAWLVPLLAAYLRRPAAAAPVPRLAACGTLAPEPAIARWCLASAKSVTSVAIAINQQFG
jgi:hypothetical protein